MMRFREYMSKLEDIGTFIRKRKDGASKIAQKARKKGGVSELTYHHFDAKLPVYQRFKDKRSPTEMEERYKDVLSRLRKLDDLSQSEFQRLTGKLEVLGEVMIEIRNSRPPGE